MKPTDSQNEPTETPWPSVLRIASDEFQQSFAVAQLAVKLCEMEKVASGALMLDPDKYLEKAWELIKKSREHVVRPQTDAEYLAAHGGSHEAAVNVIGRKLAESSVPFEKLCDPERNKGDSELIHGVHWKVYRSERGFDDLFWDYWHDCGEQWKERKVAGYSETERAQMQTLARDNDAWKRRGESVLASRKRDGMPPNTFLDLAKFRRERDNRAENLKKKRKRKRRRSGSEQMERHKRKRRESRKERIRKS